MTFYRDDSSAIGVNNATFKDVAMPHVLWELQGWQEPVYDDNVAPDGSGDAANAEKQIVGMKLIEPGKLTPDEKAVLQATAIKEYEELPPQYQSHDPSTGKIDSRAATMAILDIRNNWEQLSPTVQSLMTSLFSRQDTEFSFVSPTGFFRLHYGLRQVPW